MFRAQRRPAQRGPLVTGKHLCDILDGRDADGLSVRKQGFQVFRVDMGKLLG